VEYSKIVKKISERISYDKPDVLHLCTSASISLVKDFIILQLARKHHVKTVVHYHFGRIPEIAKKNNCTITGTGYQDIYWGQLISSIAGSTQKITKIKGSSSYNVEDYGIALAKAHGAGLTLEEFDSQVASVDRITDEERQKVIESGEYLPSYMWNVNGWLCEKLGLTVKHQTQKTVPQTYKEDIYGYKLPSGEWSNTTLCRAVLDDKPDNVKRFVIFDEFDTFGEGASVAANNTLSQGEVIINDVVHYIKPNTIFIAISNTNGKGATDVYTARNSIDDATVDRFTFIKVDHDFKREQAVTNDNRELITFCHKMRAFFEQNGYNTQFSLRTLIQITNLQDKIGVEKALEISLLKQLTDDVDFFNLFNEQYAMSAEDNIYEETMKRISLKVIENMKNQN
jgi:hypothetical protein